MSRTASQEVSVTRQRLREIARRAPQPAPPWLAGAHDLLRMDGQWLAVTACMLVPALVYFGWRGAVQVGLTGACSTLGYSLVESLLRSLRMQRTRLVSPYAVWLGLLLGLCLPMTLNLLVPAVAGLLLGVVAHLVGRTGPVRIHPVGLVLVLVWSLPLAVAPVQSQSMSMQVVDAVLAPPSVVLGDVTKAPPDIIRRPWWTQTRPGADPAVRRHPPQRFFLQEKNAILDNANHLRFLLSSGQLPRLEEVILGMAPGPIGATSPLLMILLGLYLIHRRLASWRIALAAWLAALAVAVVWLRLTPAGERLLVLDLVAMGPAAAVTFLAYLFLASPLPLIFMVLGPATSPMARAGRYVYGLVLGATTTALLLSTATPAAAFVGLIAAGLLTPALDAMHRSPFVAKDPDMAGTRRQNSTDAPL